ncbi:MAG: hypothetical protein ACE5IJ_12220, partial [Thermoplasmata archaeon]
MSQQDEEEPRLFKELHSHSSLDRILEATFRLRENSLPFETEAGSSESYASASRALLAFICLNTHQAEYVLGRDRLEEQVPEPVFAVWDFYEECSLELLTSALLLRTGFFPQAVTHIRRAWEVIVETAFISTSYIPNGAGDYWSPFAQLYLSDLWQHYVDRGLGLKEVKKTLHTELPSSTLDSVLEDFTAFYLYYFPTPYCGRHHNRRVRRNARRGLSEPLSVKYELSKECSLKSCKKPASFFHVERPPTFDLMRRVVSVVLNR